MAKVRKVPNDIAGYRVVDASELVVHPKNPRRGDLSAIRESISKNGFVGTLVVQTRTGHILVGNHRFRAATELGIRKFPCVFMDVDDEAALRILLADNRAGDLSGWDDRELAEMLRSVADLSGTGFDAKDLAKLDASLVPPTPPEFENLAETVKTNHVCPKCGYRS